MKSAEDRLSENMVVNRSEVFRYDENRVSLDELPNCTGLYWTNWETS